MSNADVFTPWATPHDRTRLILRMVAATLALGIIAFGALWVFSRGPYVSDRPFDAREWANAHPFSDDTRWRMRDDLRDNYLRPGISVADVEALLGAGEGDSDLRIYALRNRGYVDPRYDQLVIVFSGNGRLVSTHINSARGD